MKTSLLWLKRIPQHIGKIKTLIFMASSMPLIVLLLEYHYGALGFKPIDRMAHVTGLTSLILLLVTLMITPLRRCLTWTSIQMQASYGKHTSDWNWIIKLRRMIGVFSFFYATLHLIVYYWLDQGADFSDIWSDISDRPFVLIGVLAYIMLIPVTLTSTDSMMRRLGKNWRCVHRLVYPIAILAVVHFWMLTKIGVHQAYPYMAGVFLLLGWRVWFAWRKKAYRIPDDGMETVRREIRTKYTRIE